MQMNMHAYNNYQNAYNQQQNQYNNMATQQQQHHQQQQQQTSWGNRSGSRRNSIKNYAAPPPPPMPSVHFRNNDASRMNQNQSRTNRQQRQSFIPSESDNPVNELKNILRRSNSDGEVCCEN